MRQAKNLKIKFLGIIPSLIDKTGKLNPQQLVALSALVTFKGWTVKKLIEQIKSSGEELDQKVIKIIEQSSLRGHASMATTPTIALFFEGSKFLDSMLSGIIFSSSLMASGRRTGTTPKDIVYPTSILKNKRAKKLFYQTSKQNIDFFNLLLRENIAKDEASRILPYGILGTGIIVLPLESLASFAREFMLEKNWLPEEAEIFLEQVKTQLKKDRADQIFNSRLIAPRNMYPYPNIFKDPRKPNLVRELTKKHQLTQKTKIISLEVLKSSNLKKAFKLLEKKQAQLNLNRKSFWQNWQDIQLIYRQLARDFANVISVKILSTVPWRVWGEKKRHRTVPMISESIYYCIQQTASLFKKLQKKIEHKKITPKDIIKIERRFTLAPTIIKNEKFLYQWLERASASLQTYEKLIKLGIPAKDAVFVIPRALNIDVFQDYNLFNLITGYYPLRLCSTAEKQMLALTEKEAQAIEKKLDRQGLKFIAQQIKPKCYLGKFCPERVFCQKIVKLDPQYNRQKHEKVNQIIINQFRKITS